MFWKKRNEVPAEEALNIPFSFEGVRSYLGQLNESGQSVKTMAPLLENTIVAWREQSNNTGRQGVTILLSYVLENDLQMTGFCGPEAYEWLAQQGQNATTLTAWTAEVGTSTRALATAAPWNVAEPTPEHYAQYLLYLLLQAVQAGLTQRIAATRPAPVTPPARAPRETTAVHQGARTRVAAVTATATGVARPTEKAGARPVHMPTVEQGKPLEMKEAMNQWMAAAMAPMVRDPAMVDMSRQLRRNPKWIIPLARYADHGDQDVSWDELILLALGEVAGEESEVVPYGELEGGFFEKRGLLAKNYEGEWLAHRFERGRTRINEKLQESRQRHLRFVDCNRLLEGLENGSARAETLAHRADGDEGLERLLHRLADCLDQSLAGFNRSHEVWEEQNRLLKPRDGAVQTPFKPVELEPIREALADAPMGPLEVRASIPLEAIIDHAVQAIRSQFEIAPEALNALYMDLNRHLQYRGSGRSGSLGGHSSGWDREDQPYALVQAVVNSLMGRPLNAYPSVEELRENGPEREAFDTTVRRAFDRQRDMYYGSHTPEDRRRRVEKSNEFAQRDWEGCRTRFRTCLDQLVVRREEGTSLHGFVEDHRRYDLGNVMNESNDARKRFLERGDWNAVLQARGATDLVGVLVESLKSAEAYLGEVGRVFNPT